MQELTSIRCGKCLCIVAQTLLNNIVWSEPCECWLEETPTFTDKVKLGGNAGLLVTLRSENDTVSKILNQRTDEEANNEVSKDEEVL